MDSYDDPPDESRTVQRGETNGYDEIASHLFVKAHNVKGCVMVCSKHNGVTKENHGQVSGWRVSEPFYTGTGYFPLRDKTLCIIVVENMNRGRNVCWDMQE
jgi:hypothetical protein